MAKKMRIMLTIISSSCAIVGCTKNAVLSTQTSKIGKDWAEVQTTQQYQTEDGKIVKEKQLVKEKIKCMKKRGGQLLVDTAEECLEQNGTIVDEVKTFETRSVK